jgi:hypothetical protein
MHVFVHSILHIFVHSILHIFVLLVWSRVVSILVMSSVSDDLFSDLYSFDEACLNFGLGDDLVDLLGVDEACRNFGFAGPNTAMRVLPLIQPSLATPFTPLAQEQQWNMSPAAADPGELQLPKFLHFIVTSIAVVWQGPFQRRSAAKDSWELKAPDDLNLSSLRKVRFDLSTSPEYCIHFIRVHCETYSEPMMYTIHKSDPLNWVVEFGVRSHGDNSVVSSEHVFEIEVLHFLRGAHAPEFRKSFRQIRSSKKQRKKKQSVQDSVQDIRSSKKRREIKQSVQDTRSSKKQRKKKQRVDE